MDVVLDMRKESSTYGEYLATELSEKNVNSLYIPEGCAHGFKALEDNTIILCAQTGSYNAKADSGIKYDSFGMDWGIENPVLSDKDKGLVEFAKFNNLF